MAYLKKEDMDLFISIITAGRHNPSLSVKLDNEKAFVFSLEFINLFGDLIKNEHGIKAQGKTYQRKTPEMMDELRQLIQSHGNPKEMWDFYNVLAELKIGEYFAIVTKPLTDEEYEVIKENVLRLNTPDYDMFQMFKNNVFGDCLTNYRLVHYGQEKRQIKIGESDVNKRRCRFCGEIMPNVSYKKDAHTISEGLGNKTIITNDECDTCNERLGRDIEQDLITYLSPMRTMMSIKGKNGLTKIKDESFALYVDEPGKIHIDLFEKDSPELQHWKFEQIDDNFKWTFTHPQMINLQDVYRAVVKYAIGVLEDAELSHFKETVAWVRKEKSASDLPRLCFFWDNAPKKDEKPCITVFIRKNEDRTLPYACVEVYVSGEVIFGIIPFSNQDDRTFSQKEDWDRLMDVMKIYKQMPLVKSFSPNEDGDIRVTYNFEIKKRTKEEGE